MNSITIDILLENVKKYNNNHNDLEMINRAFECAQKMHAGQLRQSGEEYIVHPLSVAFILSELQLDCETIVAALLHDTLEDTNLTKDEISHSFNPHVAMMVDGVTKIGKINFNTKEEANATNTRKLLIGLIEEVRIILIKIADRLHNMRTLEYKKREKQIEISNETKDLYVPLAYYLGLYRIKSELEDLYLKYSNPSIYTMLSNKAIEFEHNIQNTLNYMLEDIDTLLNEQDVPHFIKSRTKNVYGIYKRIKSGKKINEMHDLLALKIVVDDIKDCYYTLGMIHNKYKPINNNFKDYIAQPKINMYQSLHTTIFGVDDHLIQTQIRTKEMDLTANNGMAYYLKNNPDKSSLELQREFQFFNSLSKINNSISDDIEFVEQVKKELFSENIYVYTSKGDIIELPVGSTVIDFAYKMSEEVGNYMSVPKINGQYGSPSDILKNKDIVSILTDNTSFGPNIEWIDECVTTGAKDAIKRFYKQFK